MEYIKEIKAFHDTFDNEQLSSGQIALWYALMYINNKCYWQEWFTVAYKSLQLHSGLSVPGIKKTRNILKQKGFIDFKDGKTGVTAKYKILTQLNSSYVSSHISSHISSHSSSHSSSYESNPLIDVNVNVNETINTPIVPYNKIVELYNASCPNLRKVSSVSEARKKAIKARLANYSIDDFKILFEKTAASDFLNGKNNRDWQANFDWLLKDANMAKVLDGNYDNRNSTGVFTANDFDHDELAKIARDKLGDF